MKLNKSLLQVVVLSSFSVSGIQAEPFSIGTVLTIEPGNANTAGNTAADACTTGSCFGMETSPGIWIWTNFGAGTDGGLVVGKDQESGGQELAPSVSNATPGEMTDAWSFFGNYGTFFTQYGNENIFDDQSCSDAACDGKTVIPSIDVAWNGSVIPMGDVNSDIHPTSLCFQNGLINIEWIVNADGTYSLDYLNDVPVSCGVWLITNMRTILRGQIQPGVFVPPTASPVIVDSVSGLQTEWIPDITSAGGYPVSCAIESQPANGMATIDAGCSFGTYVSNDGYVGVDDFVYSISSGFVSDSATVTVNVRSAVCESYPVQMVTTSGGGQSQTTNDQLTTTFIGRITTQQGLTSGAKNKVIVCPGSRVEFESQSSTGAAKCKINGVATGSTGSLKSGDRLICSNKPEGGDVDRYSVKSGL